MPLQVTVVYEGNMQCVSTHVPSGDSLRLGPMAGPTFSPLHLLGSGLGGWVAMVMGKIAERHGLDVTGLKMGVAMELSEGSPSRCQQITLTVFLPRKFSEADLAKFRNAAGLCPVHNSLHPDVKVSVAFVAPT